jgi:transcriptional regulator with XRE-family HTH domain
MADALNISPNPYTKYERALNLPSFKSQIILSEKFDIYLDGLLLNNRFQQGNPGNQVAGESPFPTHQ